MIEEQGREPAAVLPRTTVADRELIVTLPPAIAPTTEVALPPITQVHLILAPDLLRTMATALRGFTPSTP